MPARASRASALVLALALLAAGCRSGSPAADGGACPAGERDCLVWDDFAGVSGDVDRAVSGQDWDTWTINCLSCDGPTLRADDGRASLVPPNQNLQVFVATLDTGGSSGVRVSADITTSPTPQRANVGLVALFDDPEDFLDCKIEVSHGHPDGLVAIGDELAGRTTSLLASADDVGLENGRTYHVELTVPASLDEPVVCRVTGGGIAATTIRTALSSEQVDAYGEGTGQGLRIKIFDDEDDGGSRWDNFLVERV
jgi:hypothetical protein